MNINFCESSDNRDLLERVVFYREVNPNNYREVNPKNYYNYYSFTENTQVIFTTVQENSLELQYESLESYNTSSFNSLFFKNLPVQYVFKEKLLKERCYEDKSYDFQLGKKLCYEKNIDLNTIVLC